MGPVGIRIAIKFSYEETKIEGREMTSNKMPKSTLNSVFTGKNNQEEK